MPSAAPAVPWSIAWGRALERSNDRVVVTDARDGTSLSLGELDVVSRRAATVLRERGAVTGARIVVVTAAELEALVVLAGALRLGVVALLVHPDAGAARIDDVVRAAEPALTLLSSPQPDHPERLALADPAFTAALVGADPADDLVGPDLDADAVVLFSSGSTGPARGVRLSHRAVQDGLRRAAHALPPSSGRREGLPFRLHTVTGYRLAVVAPVLLGTTAVLLPPVPSPAAMLADADEHRVEVLYPGPGFVRAWARSPAEQRAPPPVHVRRVYVGGGGLEPDERRAFARGLGVTLHHAYGATETAGTVAVTTTRPDGHEEEGLMPLVPVRIVDDEGRELPAGAEGHVEVAPAAAMSGYLGGGPPCGRWIAPGDLGHLDAAGRLFVRGRATRLWASPAGLKVQLEDLEEVLRQELGVDVIVAGGDALGVLLEGPAPSEGWVRRARERLRARVPEYAVPTRWRACPALPRLAGGKPDLAAAARLLAEAP